MKKIVIKLGTGILSAGKGTIRTDRMEDLARSIANLSVKGVETIIVSSGAVGLGMGKLGIEERPKDLSLLRACASIGQCRLMNAWSKSLEKAGLVAAQVLLTREDFESRKRSQKVEETLTTLLKQKVVPIVNENDSVSDEEIKFGDNDVLSALLASIGKADFLIILSTAKGLMTHPISGTLIPFVAEITPSIEAMAKGTPSATAVGGMITKIEAAKIACRSGCAVFIGSGEKPAELSSIIYGENVQGTFFAPNGLELSERKKWLAFFPAPKGYLTIDHGAEEAIIKKGGSLLAIGISAIGGDFEKADVVEIKNRNEQIIARGITRFSKNELQGIRGKQNEEILAMFPGKNRPEVIHRDHLAPLQGEKS
ncbi:MAG: glutamate 5-kinase [Opitutales bacterium]